MKKIPVRLKDAAYDVTLWENGLARAGEVFDLDRRVLIVTDDGVPEALAEAVAGACRKAAVYRFPHGEDSKNLNTYGGILSAALAAGLTRRDAVVAVGGGVTGDLAGFAAATYLRGVDFYNTPTTLLSAVDSSVGGKTGVDLDGVKNAVGAFWQPRGVLIDRAVLATLSRRQFAAGFAEIVKIAATCDAAFFEKLEKLELPWRAPGAEIWNGAVLPEPRLVAAQRTGGSPAEPGTGASGSETVPSVSSGRDIPGSETRNGAGDIELSAGATGLELSAGAADMELPVGAGVIEVSAGAADMELSAGAADMELPVGALPAIWAEIIARAVELKRDVVEKDPREGGLRRVLNFGHTLGHAVESAAGGRLLHGECVAIGMLPFAAGEARERLSRLLSRWGLPTRSPYAAAELLPYLTHDKKSAGGRITAVEVKNIGTYGFVPYSPEEILQKWGETV